MQYRNASPLFIAIIEHTCTASIYDAFLTNALDAILKLDHERAANFINTVFHSVRKAQHRYLMDEITVLNEMI